MFNGTVTAKFLMRAKIRYKSIPYTFLNVCEKIHHFLSSIKKDTQKKIGPFYLPHSAVITHQSLQLNGVIGYIQRIHTIYDKTDNFFQSTVSQ